MCAPLRLRVERAFQKPFWEQFGGNGHCLCAPGGLGTPKAGREAARKGRVGEMREIVPSCLQEHAAQFLFEQLKADSPTTLVCFEADACGCHRAVIAERMASDEGFRIVNLSTLRFDGRSAQL